MVLDDEPFALELISSQLADLGFDDVTALEHPQDALALPERGTGAIH